MKQATLTTEHKHLKPLQPPTEYRPEDSPVQIGYTGTAYNALTLSSAKKQLTY